MVNMGKFVYIMKDGKRTCAGEIVEKTYITTRTRETFFRIYSGFGVSLAVLEYLRVNGVQNVLIEYFGVKGRKNYRTTLDKFFDMSKVHEYRDGIDLQHILPESEFTVY